MLTPSATVLQGVDVQAASVSSIRREPRVDDGHLEDFVALLLAAGEAFVDGAVHEARIHLQQLHLVLDELEELDRVEFRLAAMLADGVDGGLEEIAGADAGDFDRILKRQEDAFARPLLGGQFEQIFAVDR